MSPFLAFKSSSLSPLLSAIYFTEGNHCFINHCLSNHSGTWNELVWTVKVTNAGGGCCLDLLKFPFSPSLLWELPRVEMSWVIRSGLLFLKLGERESEDTFQVAYMWYVMVNHKKFSLLTWERLGLLQEQNSTNVFWNKSNLGIQFVFQN